MSLPHPAGPSTGSPPGANSYAPDAETVARLRERAQFIRLETIRLIDIAKTGHYTSVFSAAEMFAALYYDVMNLRRGEPGWHLGWLDPEDAAVAVDEIKAQVI